VKGLQELKSKAGTREATREFLAFVGKEPRAVKIEGRAMRALEIASRSSALHWLCAPSRSSRWRRRNTEKRCEDASHSESTSCKVHGKRLAAFREALGVRTRRRVASTRTLLYIAYAVPKVPPGWTKEIW